MVAAEGTRADRTDDAPEAAAESSKPAREERPVRGRRFSPITLRILAVNVLALAILVAGLLYLGEYQRSLVAASLDSLKIQSELIAGAVAEGAASNDPRVERALEQVVAQQLVRRLTEPGQIRARLFDTSGRLVADSRDLAGAARAVIEEDLPPPERGGWVGGVFVDLYEWVVGLMPGGPSLPPYIETPVPLARDYGEVVLALAGEFSSEVRAGPDGHMVLSVATPVQRYRRVLGALMLTMDSGEIEASVRAVRLDIVKVFAIALTITVILSIYLAGTIARPIRRLAEAADRVRRVRNRSVVIPDFSSREDEVGELSSALRDMTDAMWTRMDAIERFAADVSHEIKNPLSSLRSAVETAARVDDPEKQRRLLAIVQEDVQRLDRLITDISAASRLDAELSRLDTERLDLGAMLQSIAGIEAETKSGGPGLSVDARAGQFFVFGNEGQLVQVFRNLIENAVSFSPGDGAIVISVRRQGDEIIADVADDGRGIPEGKEEAIFERFYTERPDSEKFGTHSGLGLSISRQIVEAHGGRLVARNRRASGRVIGAVFTITLPAA